MHIRTFLFTSLFIGVLLCAYQNGWIIICLPSKAEHLKNDYESVPNHKKIVLTWWHEQSWHTETVDMVWPSDKSCALEALANTWLAMIAEEKNERPISILQTGMFAIENKIAYLSFDRNPLDKQLSIYDKLRWIDGLSKTILNNGLTCTHIQVLVHHVPLHDVHLDFSKPWPITGFVDSVS